MDGLENETGGPGMDATALQSVLGSMEDRA